MEVMQKMLSSNLADFDFGQSFQLSLEAAWWGHLVESNQIKLLTDCLSHPSTNRS